MATRKQRLAAMRAVVKLIGENDGGATERYLASKLAQ